MKRQEHPGKGGRAALTAVPASAAPRAAPTPSRAKKKTLAAHRPRRAAAANSLTVVRGIRGTTAESYTAGQLLKRMHNPAIENETAPAAAPVKNFARFKRCLIGLLSAPTANKPVCLVFNLPTPAAVSTNSLLGLK